MGIQRGLQTQWEGSSDCPPQLLDTGDVGLSAWATSLEHILEIFSGLSRLASKDVSKKGQVSPEKKRWIRFPNPQSHQAAWLSLLCLLHRLLQVLGFAIRLG